MKKLGVVVALGLFFLMRASATFAAVDLSIGGTAWYIWWIPAWEKAKTITTAYTDGPIIVTGDDRNFRPASNVMGGPVISIGFLDRWSIKSVFAIGRFAYHSAGAGRNVTIYQNGFDMWVSHGNNNRSLLKWESDTTLECAVNRVFRIFAGFRSQGYRNQERSSHYTISGFPEILKRVLSGETRGYGCGLGFGLHVPLATDFSLIMEASGMALWFQEKIRINYSKTFLISLFGGYIPYWQVPNKGKFLSYGGTAALAFEYAISKVNTTLALGGRYQLLVARQKYGNPFKNDASLDVVDGEFDHSFGVTLSVIYTFHIGRKKIKFTVEE